MEEIIDLYEAELDEMTNAKEVLKLLKEMKVLTIRWFYDRGYSGRSIANQLGLSNTRVSQIIKSSKVL